VRLSAAGRRTVALRFSPRELRALWAGLHRHRRVEASMRGVLIDPAAYGVLPLAGGSIEKRTGARSLRISS
jgi:hypothetical protein